jgi:hypothetical protein
MFFASSDVQTITFVSNERVNTSDIGKQRAYIATFTEGILSLFIFSGVNLANNMSQFLSLR